MLTLTSQLLIASLAMSTTPPAQQLAACSQVLWVQQDGRVLASGEESTARGDSSEKPRNHFETIEGLTEITSVFLAPDSEEGAAALDRNGRAWVWGSDWCPRVRSEEECEDDSHVPGMVAGLEEIESLALGSYHLIALGKNGRVHTLGSSSWTGGNEYGQLGAGDTEAHSEVVVVEGIDDAVAVAAAAETSFILRADGSVWGMGNSWGGTLGAGAQEESSLFQGITEQSGNPLPVPIQGLSGIAAIAIGNRFGIALDRSGRVWGWGINDSGQLGLPANEMSFSRPSVIPGLTSIRAIAAGYDFTLALRRDGRVLALGGNVYGALGDKKGELEGEIRVISGLSGVRQIYAGHYNAFARLEDGSFRGWGANHPGVGGFHPRADLNALPPTLLEADLRRAPPSALVAGGGAALRIGDELGYDQRSETVEIYFDGKSFGTLSLDSSTTEAELKAELAPGVHSYELKGKTRMDEGVRKIVGRGFVVVAPEPPGQRFEKAVAQQGLVAAIRELQQDLESQAPGITPNSVVLEASGALDESALVQAEKALGFSLPPAYRRALSDLGPFQLGPAGARFPSIALYAPNETRNLETWFREGLTWSQGEAGNELEEEAQWGFEYLAEETTPSLHRDWQQSLIGAAIGLRHYSLAPQNAACEDGSPRARWADFFEAEIHEETGEELYFLWNDYSECDLGTLDELSVGAGYVLQAGYAEAGVVFVTANAEGEEVGLYFERGKDDGKVLQLRLVDFNGWEE